MDQQRIKEKMEELESIIRFPFKDISHLKKAMCSSIIGTRRKEYANEGLATVGDAVLKTVIADNLYEVKKITAKGEITKAKSKLESNKTLYKVMINKGLITFAYNDKHFYGDNDIPDNEKVAAGEHDAYLEAIIGAMYYDSGFEKTKEWIVNWLMPLLDEYQ